MLVARMLVARSSGGPVPAKIECGKASNISNSTLAKACKADGLPVSNAKSKKHVENKKQQQKRGTTQKLSCRYTILVSLFTVGIIYSSTLIQTNKLTLNVQTYLNICL